MLQLLARATCHYYYSLQIRRLTLAVIDVFVLENGYSFNRTLNSLAVREPSPCLFDLVRIFVGSSSPSRFAVQIPSCLLFFLSVIKITGKLYSDTSLILVTFSAKDKHKKIVKVEMYPWRHVLLTHSFLFWLHLWWWNSIGNLSEKLVVFHPFVHFSLSLHYPADLQIGSTGWRCGRFRVEVSIIISLSRA